MKTWVEMCLDFVNLCLSNNNNISQTGSKQKIQLYTACHLSCSLKQNSEYLPKFVVYNICIGQLFVTVNQKTRGHWLVSFYTLMMSHCFSQSHCLMSSCILASVQQPEWDFWELPSLHSVLVYTSLCGSQIIFYVLNNGHFQIIYTTVQKFWVG